MVLPTTVRGNIMIKIQTRTILLIHEKNLGGEQNQLINHRKKTGEGIQGKPSLPTTTFGNIMKRLFGNIMKRQLEKPQKLTSLNSQRRKMMCKYL